MSACIKSLNLVLYSRNITSLYFSICTATSMFCILHYPLNKVSTKGRLCHRIKSAKSNQTEQWSSLGYDKSRSCLCVKFIYLSQGYVHLLWHVQIINDDTVAFVALCAPKTLIKNSAAL